MLGENPHHFRRGIRTHYTGKYGQLTDGTIKSLFQNVDLISYNCEFSLVDETFNFPTLRTSIYRAPLSSLQVFPDNVRIVANIANNHFSQHGQESAKYTKSELRKRGVTIVGEDHRPVEIKIKDKTLLFWGVSLIEDVKYCSEYFISTYERICREIELNTKRVDQTWILSIHWGDEYVGHPSEQQIDLGNRLIEMGFDVIYGHHPHVVQPVAKVNDCVIHYSMGNFIFDQNFSIRTQRGLISLLDLDNTPANLSAYTSNQHHYRVIKITPYKPLRGKANNVFAYRGLKILNEFLMRVLMKLELLWHWRHVDAEVIRYLKDRILTI